MSDMVHVSGFTQRHLWRSRATGMRAHKPEVGAVAVLAEPVSDNDAATCGDDELVACVLRAFQHVPDNRHTERHQAFHVPSSVLDPPGDPLK
jgi:hypothetical protein